MSTYFFVDQQVLGYFNPLPHDPFESTTLLDRAVILERSSEIIAKKMWHRGNQATARDLFDFAAVHLHDPGAIEEASPFFPDMRTPSCSTSPRVSQ